MAGARRLEQDVRRVRRWAHTTGGALDASALIGAGVLAVSSSWLIAALTDIGRWALLIAALPLANQIRVQVTTSERWRRRFQPEGDSPALPASLAGVDLSGLDLSGHDLRRRTLADTDLTDADLTGADLVAADLRRATLAGARLGRADLSYGTLDRADCARAGLYGAILVEATLRDVEARNTNLERTDLRNADLRGADLLGARFRGADVRGADFTGAKLAADALADAIVDVTTTLADGSAGDPVDDSSFSQIRSMVAVVLSGLALALARPALHGLLVAALGTGTVMAAQTSGGGLGQELAIVTSADRDLADLVPRAKPRLPVDGTANSSTDGAVGDVATGREDSTPAELGELIAPGSVDGEEGSSSGGETSADPGLTESITPTAAQRAGDQQPNDAAASTTDAAASTTEPDQTTTSGASDQPGPSGDPSSADPEPTSSEDDGSEQPRDTTPGLTEVDPVTPPAGQTAVRRIRIVVASEGGQATVTAVSSLGQLEPRIIDGPDGWELGLPSGEIRVDVSPSAEGVSTACQIQVDGIERSFQSSLAGQTAICIVDLDPAAG